VATAHYRHRTTTPRPTDGIVDAAAARLTAQPLHGSRCICALPTQIQSRFRVTHNTQRQVVDAAVEVATAASQHNRTTALDPVIQAVLQK